jgi:hypothetical protein
MTGSLVPGDALDAAGTMAVTRTASGAPPRWWTAGLAWALWALGMLGVVAIWRLDHLLRQAGRSDLAPLGAGVAAPVVAVLAITFAPSSFDQTYRPRASPLDLSGFGGPLLVIHQLAFGVANFAVVAGAVSLVVRFRRARGIERRCSSRPAAASSAASTAASTGAALIIQAFSGRLRQQVDLDTLTAELLAVAEQTMQPTRVSLWLRPHQG